MKTIEDIHLTTETVAEMHAKKLMRDLDSYDGPIEGRLQVIDDTYKKLREYAGTPTGKAMIDLLDQSRKEKIASLKDIALANLFDMLSNVHTKDQVRAQLIRMVLGDKIGQTSEALEPDELVFDTVISDDGTINQTIKKNYRSREASALEEQEALDPPQLPS